MKEVEIIRDVVVVVDTVGTVDNYGKLTFSDKEGGTHTINQKHAHLHPVIQEGKAVHLFYGEYMDREFIHKAELVEGELPPPTKPQAPKDYPDKEEVKPTVKNIRKDDRNASFALSYAKDICVAGVTSGHLELGKVKTFTCILASAFLDWLNGE